MLLALSSCEHGALAPRAPFLSAGSGGGAKKVQGPKEAPAAEKARAAFRRILQRTVHLPERHTSAGASDRFEIVPSKNSVTRTFSTRRTSAKRP